MLRRRRGWLSRLRRQQAAKATPRRCCCRAPAARAAFDHQGDKLETLAAAGRFSVLVGPLTRFVGGGGVSTVRRRVRELLVKY